MKRSIILIASLLFIITGLAFAAPAPTLPGLVAVNITNSGTTGTTVNKLAKINSSGNALIVATTDTDNAVGVVLSGAGTTGLAQIAVSGVVSCVFDATATTGNYVQISSTVAGDCKDSGAATRPATGQVIGKVITGGSGVGIYTLSLQIGAPNAGTGTVTSAIISGGGGLTTSGTCTITSSGTCVIYTPGGNINKFRNGGMDIWQRGLNTLSTASVLAKPCVSTADGWCVVQTGAQFTCSQGTQVNNGAAHYLGCAGGTSNTDTLFSQRIESSVATPLASSTVTVQFYYNQNTGGSITPKVSTCFASATDNFTTCTADLASTSLTACASTVWCSEAYTFNVSSSASQGYQVTFDCNTALTAGQACLITAADIRVTPNVATGINANPPPPELRNVSSEMAYCLRYLEVISSASAGAIGVGIAQAASTSRAVLSLNWKAMKRIAPTVTLSATSDWSYYNTAIGGFVVWSTFTPTTTEWGGVLDVTTTTAGLGGAGTATIATPNAATTNARIFINSEL